MQDVSNPPRKRSRWLLFVMPGVLVVLAIGWTGFWFYASSQVGAQFERWRTREAQSGRVYDCGKLIVGGYPFRFEVRCQDASVDLISQTANRKFGKGQLSEILAVAQIYNPRLLIAEFDGPLTVTEQGEQQSLIVNWSKAQSSVFGLPVSPQRMSLVVDEPTLERSAGSVRAPIGRAKRSELHGRIAEGSAAANPVIEAVVAADAGKRRAAASGAGRGVRHDGAGALERAEGFSAKTVARALPRDSGGERPHRDPAVAAAAGQHDRGRIRIARHHAARHARRRAADGGGGPREDRAGARHRQDPRAGRVAGDARPAGAGPEGGAGRQGHGRARQADPGPRQCRAPEGAGCARRHRRHARAEDDAGRPPAQAFPLRFADGAVYLGRIRFAQTPPLF